MLYKMIQNTWLHNFFFPVVVFNVVSFSVCLSVCLSKLPLLRCNVWMPKPKRSYSYRIALQLVQLYRCTCYVLNWPSCCNLDLCAKKIISACDHSISVHLNAVLTEHYTFSTGSIATSLSHTMSIGYVWLSLSLSYFSLLMQFSLCFVYAC